MPPTPSTPDPRYHHDSRRVTLAGRIIAALIAYAGAILCAFVYVHALLAMPFIYPAIVLSVLFGAGIGLAVARGTLLGKIRSASEARRLAVMAALLGFVLHWLLWLERVFARSDTPIRWHEFITHPIWLADALRVVYENGTWTFVDGFGGMAHNAPNVNGVFLVLIWIGEAIAIFVPAIVLSTWWQNRRAFCEHCNNWCLPPRVLHSYASGISGAEIKLHLEQKDFEFLGLLPGYKRNEPTHIDLEYQLCPCGQTRLLNLHRVTTYADRRGRFSTTRIGLMEGLIVDESEVKGIQSIAPMSRVADPEPRPEDDYVDLGPT